MKISKLVFVGVLALGLSLGSELCSTGELDAISEAVGEGRYGSYEDLKADLINKMYHRQIALIPNKQQYSSFVEGYLQDVEDRLEIVRYCKKHPNTPLAEQIVDFFVRYNVCAFHAVCMRNITSGIVMRAYTSQINDLNTKVKQELGIDFDIQAENKRFKEFVSEGNQQYFKQLDFAKRVGLTVNSIFTFAL